MLRIATIHFSIVLLVMAMPASAREHPPTQGSAIGIEYSIQHDTMRPGEDVSLLLCLTNSNTNSTRDVAPGDSFSFDFPEGIVRGCGDLSAYSPDGSLALGSLACDVTSNVVRMTYVGPTPTRWPVGDAVCVLVPYGVGSGPSTVGATMDVSNQGAYLAPSPAVLLLSVARGLGTAGPPGPAGPQGVAGPPGPTGIRNWAFATSTAMAQARENEPPVPIPGLDIMLDVLEGSSIEVTADTLARNCVPPYLLIDGNDTGIGIEVDGVVMAQRSVSEDGVSGGWAPADPDGMVVHWISGALSAGSHRVRVLVIAPHPLLPTRENFTWCVGSAANDEYQARLSVKELPPHP